MRNNLSCLQIGIAQGSRAAELRFNIAKTLPPVFQNDTFLPEEFPIHELKDFFRRLLVKVSLQKFGRVLTA